MRVNKRDIIDVLRRFELADDDSQQRHIEHIKYFNPSTHNTLVTFRFNRNPLFLLFDDSAEDDKAYVESQVKLVDSGAKGEVSLNPHDETATYALPFKGKSVYLFVSMNPKERLDVRLSEDYPDTSRSTWQKYIKDGRVSVNGQAQKQPKYRTSDSDKISISLPDGVDNSSESLPIIYLDDNVIVVDKPAGVLTHAKGAVDDEFTVADFFARYSSYKTDTNRPGVIHRLDRDTSGVIIGARNEDTAKLLQKQFADRRTKKTYLAILASPPKLEAAVVELPIGRNPASPSRFRVDPSGKPARTVYKTLATNDRGHTLVRLMPETGRTHQLRVHMAHLNTPILGDRVYGEASERLFLHASELEITIPGGERKTFSSDTPSRFKDMFPEVQT